MDILRAKTEQIKLHRFLSRSYLVASASYFSTFAYILIPGGWRPHVHELAETALCFTTGQGSTTNVV